MLKNKSLLCQKAAGELLAPLIAWEKVIPSMQGGKHCKVMAVASANKEKAVAIASQHHIPTVYISYEALLAEPEIDAVYILLPNHLLVP